MGADIPVALRSKGLKQGDAHPVETEPTSEFRGESYVHGVMDGEALVMSRQQRERHEDVFVDKSWLGK